MTDTTPSDLKDAIFALTNRDLGSGLFTLDGPEVAALLAALPADLVAAATAPPLPTEGGSRAIVYTGTACIRREAILVWGEDDTMVWMDMEDGRPLVTKLIQRWEPIPEPKRPTFTVEELVRAWNNGTPDHRWTELTEYVNTKEA